MSNNPQRRKPTPPYRTISIGRCDPFYGAFFVWSCLCGEYDHGIMMVDHRNRGCINCGLPDRAELDDFYRKGPLYRKAVQSCLQR